MASTPSALRGCPCCGLVQQLPPPRSGWRAACHRCHAPFPTARKGTRGRLRAVAAALAALILYVPAITLPMLRLERLGQVREDNLLGGIVSLLSAGHWFVGLVVLVFSVIVPPLKLITLLVLGLGGAGFATRHQAAAYRLVELVGRWGMLDVMLVAVLVAFVKLGNLAEIQAGPGLLAFALCVLASLIASVCFDPHDLWREPCDG
ncbi:MAG: paraquat-inducible protein A [Pirellulales bacterium]